MTRRWLGAVTVVLLVGAPARAAQSDACTVVSTDEVKAALGRQTLGATKPGRSSGPYSECTFSGAGAGDVRVLIGPPSKDAAADFALKAEILREERKKYERLTVAGGPAYYYEDRLEFLAGNRDVAIWVNRTPRTETEAAVKSALLTLGDRIASRLR